MKIYSFHVKFKERQDSVDNSDVFVMYGFTYIPFRTHSLAEVSKQIHCTDVQSSSSSEHASIIHGIHSKITPKSEWNFNRMVICPMS